MSAAIGPAPAGYCGESPTTGTPTRGGRTAKLNSISCAIVHKAASISARKTAVIGWRLRSTLRIWELEPHLPAINGVGSTDSPPLDEKSASRKLIPTYRNVRGRELERS